MKAAHLHVLLNCDEVQPYIDHFVESLQKSELDISPRDINDRIEAQFSSWFRDFVSGTGRGNRKSASRGRLRKHGSSSHLPFLTAITPVTIPAPPMITATPQRKYCFSPLNLHLAKINFEKHGVARMKSLLADARKLNQKPPWIGDDLWSRLSIYWRSNDFQEKSAKSKRNRASDCGGFGSAFHTCGSITVSHHKQNTMKETGVVPTIQQLFKHTHFKKKSKAWVDDKAKHFAEQFESASQEVHSSNNVVEGSSEIPQPSTQSELDLWIKTVGGMKKGQIYGLGL